MVYNEVLGLMMYRRKQLLVNSCIYYKYGTSIISDEKFDKWAKELVQLNKDNPELVNKGEWHEAFEDFDGSTGFNLPIENDWVIRQATRLIDYSTNM